MSLPGQASQSPAPTGQSRPNTIPRRPSPTPSRRIADALAIVAGLGFGATVGLAVTAENRGSLSAPGGLCTAAGRLAGLTGAYLLMVMVLLIARLPVLERAVGQDRLLRWHRRLGPWPLWLISAHVLFITIGYAQADRTSIPRQMWTFIEDYADVLAAIVGFGLLVLAGVASMRSARRKMKYETWWVVHLYFYLALVLAFAHQIDTGASFVGHRFTQRAWAGMWALTAALVLVCRWGLPLARSVRHRLVVVDVHQEAPGVISVICAGRRLDRLAVAGGQFFHWRFLRKGMWWQAHPYSISAMPRPPYLRVTIKGLGDQSGAAARLRRGTRVAIEGPYGTFTHHARSTDGVVLLGAGVGVTPLRALLEDLPEAVDVVVILRGSSSDDLVLADEIEALVSERHGVLHRLVGSRADVQLDASTLRRLVPDIASRDLYICGPEGFAQKVVRAARAIGVEMSAIHREAFAF